MKDISRIIPAVASRYPGVQAIYLFGTYGGEYERKDSDVDIALLLPPGQAGQVGELALGDLQIELESMLDRDVDLINLRLASTVLAKEATVGGQRIFTADAFAADEFEMMTLSYYVKLKEQTADIIESGLREGRFRKV